MGQEIQRVEQVGALSREILVRVVNCDPQGCLLEAPHQLRVGTVARLHLTFGGQGYDDLVQVTRCQIIRGAGSTYHAAMQFLSTTPPYAGTLRHGIRAELLELQASSLLDR